MAKTKTVFYCTSCGNEFPKWQGKCPACGEWNTMEEHVEKPMAAGSISLSVCKVSAGIRGTMSSLRNFLANPVKKDWNPSPKTVTLCSFSQPENAP